MNYAEIDAALTGLDAVVALLPIMDPDDHGEFDGLDDDDYAVDPQTLESWRERVRRLLCKLRDDGHADPCLTVPSLAVSVLTGPVLAGELYPDAAAELMMAAWEVVYNVEQAHPHREQTA